MPPGRAGNQPAGAHEARRRYGFGAALGAVALAGFALRAYYILTVRSHQRLWGDALFYYYGGAEALARGHGYVAAASGYGQLAPSAKHPPGFVTLLAGLYKLGFQSPDALMYWMAALGSVTVVLVGVVGARVVSRRAGLIAAAIAAIYPNIWINDTTLMSETLMTFGFTLALGGIYAFHRRASWRSLVVASVGLTVATSARAETIVLFAIVILPLVLARRSVPFRRRVGFVAIAAIAPVAVFAPWAIYNSTRFSDPVLLSTGFGPTALAASCDTVFYGSHIGYYDLRCNQINEPPPPPPGQAPDESKIDQWSRKRAFDYVKAHRDQVPEVVAAREGRLFSVWNPSQQNQLDHYVQQRGSVALVTTAQWAFWALALLAIAGGWLWRKRKIPLYPLIGEIVLTAVVAAVTFGSTRYRCAVEICVVLLAATAIDAGIRLVRNRFGHGESQTGDSEDSPAPPTPRGLAGATQTGQ